MAKKMSTGKCEKCGRIAAKNAMTRHVEQCFHGKESAESGGGKKGEKIFHILIEARGGPMYWLHVDAPASASLEDLDFFLRDIWLECCGHLSAFDIEGGQYISDPSFYPGDIGMDDVIGDMLEPGMKFSHDYDFGTTTELKLKVISARKGAADGNDIRLLARNEPPEISCDVCGEPAVQICCECEYEGKGRLCAACAKKHKCGEDMLLPVVNSPRAGVCGYSGPSTD